MSKPMSSSFTNAFGEVFSGCIAKVESRMSSNQMREKGTREAKNPKSEGILIPPNVIGFGDSSPYGGTMKALKVIVAALLFSAVALAQIPGLCNTGEATRTRLGCSGVLVIPNPTGGGPNRDGNWEIAFPYPSNILTPKNACDLGFVPAWVDTPLLQQPIDSWLPNDVSTASEWITPFDGEGNQPQGWFIYRTNFRVPLVLPSGIAPKGFVIHGRIASDNQTYAFALTGLKYSDSCALVEGLPAPINPAQYGAWTNFSFTNPTAIIPGSDVFLYALVYNARSTGDPNATGLRVEFFDTSAYY